MVGTEILNPTLRLSFDQFGALLVIGTVWFGALCLVNALRCGRLHCWIDGTILPALALVGLVNLGGLFHLDWESYVSAFWLILLGSVLMECAVGSYPLTSREQRKSR